MDNQSEGTIINENDNIKPVSDAGGSSAGSNDVNIASVTASGDGISKVSKTGNRVDIELDLPVMSDEEQGEISDLEQTENDGEGGINDSANPNETTSSQPSSAPVSLKNNPQGNDIDQRNAPTQTPTEEQPLEPTPTNEQDNNAPIPAPPTESQANNQAPAETPPQTKSEQPTTPTSPATPKNQPTEKPEEQPDDTNKTSAEAPNAAQQAANLNSQKAADRKEKKASLKDRIKTTGNNIRNAPSTLANKIKQSPANARKAIQGIPQNLASRLESERSRLRRQVSSLEKKRASLAGETDDTKMTAAMRIIKFFFPGLYAKLMDVSNVGQKLSAAAKIKLYNAQITKYKTLISLLNAQIGMANMASAFLLTIRIIAIGFGTVILGIIFAIISPLILFAVFIWYTIVGGPLSRAVVQIKKQVVEKLKKAEQNLEKTQKLLNLDKQISGVYKQMSQSSALPMTAAPQPPEPKTEQQTETGTQSTGNTQAQEEAGTTNGPGPYQNTEPAKPEEPPEQMPLAA